MRLIKSGDTLVDRDQLEMDMAPEFTDRSARLRLLDEQGIEAAIMLPSLGVGLEHFMMHNPGQLDANLRAFNRWLDEDWGLNFQNRIFSPPAQSHRLAHGHSGIGMVPRPWCSSDPPPAGADPGPVHC